MSLTKVLLEAHGLSITGSAGYNLGTKQIRGQVTGNNLQLSKFDTIRKAEPDADGVLSFTAIANGTLQEPDLHARLTLEKISVQGKPLGDLEAKADSTGSTLNYELQSKLVGAQVNASGETSLVGDYETKAKLTVSGLDIANVITLMAPGSFKGSSAIAGTINVSGPAKTPKVMVGSAEFDEIRPQAAGGGAEGGGAGACELAQWHGDAGSDPCDGAGHGPACVWDGGCLRRCESARWTRWPCMRMAASAWRWRVRSIRT